MNSTIFKSLIPLFMLVLFSVSPGNMGRGQKNFWAHNPNGWAKRAYTQKYRKETRKVRPVPRTQSHQKKSKESDPIGEKSKGSEKEKENEEKKDRSEESKKDNEPSKDKKDNPTSERNSEKTQPLTSPTKKKNNPGPNILSEIENIATLYSAKNPSEIQKKIMQSKKLSSEELKVVYESKKHWIQIIRIAEGKANLYESKIKSEIKGLENLIALANLQSEQIDRYVIDKIIESSFKSRERLENGHKSVFVQGGGANGQIAALKLFSSGSKVILVSDSSEFTSKQIMQLDPIWNAELNFYLGTQYQQLFDEGFARQDSEGRLEVPMNRLEEALKVQLSTILSADKSIENDFRLINDGKVTVILPPSRKQSDYRAVISFRNGQEEVSFDAYVFASGEQDPLRDNFLGKMKPMSPMKTYAQLIWDKSTKEPLKKGFSIRKTLTSKTFLPVMGPSIDHLLGNLKHLNISKKVADNIRKAVNQSSWGNEVEYRYFENKEYVMMNMELPGKFDQFTTTLRNAIEQCKSEDEISHLHNIQSIFDEEMAAIIPLMLDVDHSRLEINSRWVSTERVQQQAVEKSLNIRSTQGKNVLFVAVGGGLVTPDHFSGTGLTGGRRAVDYAVEAITQLQQSNSDEQKVVKTLETRLNEVIQFTLKQGKPFFSESSNS